MPAAAIGLGIAAAGVVGAGASVYSADKAATAQKNAQAHVMQEQQQNVNATQAQEQPYTQLGASAAGQLQSQLPSLTAPVSLSEQALEQTPGYQFDLAQGLKASQNQMAGRGLGGVMSGPAAKALASYATGLADNTYQNQFADAVTNKQNAYNFLTGAVGQG